MGTSANPMAGQYFNDPHFAAAVSNLAGAFAPPSADEYLTAEKVKGLRTSNSALADLYAQAGGDFDKLGVVADLYDPSNSYYSVDTDAATARRGQDVTAATTRDKARVDGMFGLAGTPLAYNEAMPGMSPEIAAAIGVPAFAPQAGAALGAPAPPLSETEMIAQIMAGQSPEDQRAMLDPSTVQTLDANGNAVYTSEMDAIGQPAYNATGGQAAPKPVMLVNPADGKRVSGFALPQGSYVLGDGKTPAPADFVAYEMPRIEGTAEEVGGTGSNRTLSGRIDATLAESDMLIDSLTAEIQGQAGAAGLAGTVQSVGQNILQVGRELGAAFGDDPNALVTPDMLSGLGQTDGPYDPTFARIRSGMLQLAYLNAQRDNPSGEVSRFALERQIEALGQGALANDQSILAALGMNKEANARKRAASAALLGQEVVPPGATPAVGGGPVTITSDADYDALPSGTEFTAPDGTTRRKP